MGRVQARETFQFIGFPSEWGVLTLQPLAPPEQSCFQFIGFPSEWGEVNERGYVVIFVDVSNLLGSPASGEYIEFFRSKRAKKEFPIYWVPQRVGSPKK